MEPSDLNPADEPLELLLREPAAVPLPDDGFSTRVLAALPPPRRECLLGWRNWVAVGLAAVLLLAFGPSLTAGLETAATLFDGTAGRLVDLLDRPDLLLALAIIAGTLALSADDWPETGHDPSARPNRRS